MNNNERSILTISCYGHFLSHFNMLIFPALLLPLTARYGLPLEKTLAMSFWMYLLFGISALPWGFLGDRYGARSLLMLFYLGAGVCCFGCVAAIDNTTLLPLMLAGLGLFSGIYHPVGLGWIAREVKRTSVGMAYNGIFGNLGLASAPLLAGVLNHFFGVEVVYGVVGVMNVSGVIFIFLSTDDRAVPVDSEKKNLSHTNIQPFVILLAAMMLGGVVYRGTSVSLPAYFELKNAGLLDVVGWGESLGGNLFATMTTSLLYVVGMAGQYLGGRIGESYDLKIGYLVFHAITIPAAIGMAVSFGLPLIMCAMVHSFFLLGMQPIENTLLSKLAPASLLSSAYGLKFVLTFGVGAISVKVIELVKMHHGFETIFFIFSLVSTLLVIAIIKLISSTRVYRENV